MPRLLTFCRYFSFGVVSSVVLCTRHCVELSDIYSKELLLGLESIQQRTDALKVSDAIDRHEQKQSTVRQGN